MSEQSTWAGMWLVLLAIAVGIGVHLLVTATRDSWRRTGERIDHDIAEMVNGGGLRKATNCDLGLHPGPLSRYSNYAIWLCCGQRQDQPYDQQLDPHTDLGKWTEEMS